jgi:hypothetical protein
MTLSVKNPIIYGDRLRIRNFVSVVQDISQTNMRKSIVHVEKLADPVA